MIHPCILSGGAGTRLWPRSRRFAPKQLQPLVTERSMIADTAARFAARPGFAPAGVICSADYGAAIAELLRADALSVGGVVAEPARRDTAAATALAALWVRDRDPDGFALLLPSDHHVADPVGFAATVASAAASLGEAICTFGIVPTAPETGFGYIEADLEGDLPAPVRAFVEKPSRSTAERYLESGRYLWNAGIFLFRPAVVLEEMSLHHPAILEAVEASWREARRTTVAGMPIDFPGPSFLQAAAISFDYAVMEKTRRAVVCPLDVGWSDVGSFDALSALRAADADGNSTVGDVLIRDSRNSYVESPARLAVVAGVEDVMVIDTPDALLVCHRDRVQSVKAIHAELAARGRPEADYHRDGPSRRLALRAAFRDWLGSNALPRWEADGLPAETVARARAFLGGESEDVEVSSTEPLVKDGVLRPADIYDASVHRHRGGGDVAALLPLVAFADTYAVDPSTGRLWDAVDGRGDPVATAQSLSTQIAFVRHHLRHGTAAQTLRALDLLEDLWSRNFGSSWNGEGEPSAILEMIAAI